MFVAPLAPRTDQEIEADALSEPDTQPLREADFKQMRPQGRFAKQIGSVGEENTCTSTIVAAELRYGAAKKQDGEAVFARLGIDEAVLVTSAVKSSEIEDFNWFAGARF